MNNWKKQLRKRFMPVPSAGETRYLVLGAKPQTVEDFIATEIIEKLIEDIPEEANIRINYPQHTTLKQQLRDKWLEKARLE